MNFLARLRNVPDVVAESPDLLKELLVRVIGAVAPIGRFTPVRLKVSFLKLGRGRIDMP